MSGRKYSDHVSFAGKNVAGSSCFYHLWKREEVQTGIVGFKDFTLVPIVILALILFIVLSIVPGVFCLIGFIAAVRPGGDASWLVCFFLMLVLIMWMGISIMIVFVLYSKQFAIVINRKQNHLEMVKSFFMFFKYEDIVIAQDNIAQIYEKTYFDWRKAVVIGLGVLGNPLLLIMGILFLFYSSKQVVMETNDGRFLTLFFYDKPYFGPCVGNAGEMKSAVMNEIDSFRGGGSGV